MSGRPLSASAARRPKEPANTESAVNSCRSSGSQHVIRPADGVTHRPVTRVAAASHRLEETKTLVESLSDLFHPERPGSRRRQLDGQRDPVQAPADLDDQAGGGIVEDERGIGGPSPGHEQRRRRDGQCPLGGDLCLRRRRRQRLDGPHPLTGHRQRFTAGGDDRHLRGFAQHAAHQRRHRLDEVLAVVEQQQAVAGVEHLHDGVVDRAAPSKADVDGGGDGRRGGLLVDDAHQFHHVHAIRVARRRPAGELEAEGGLAHPTGTHEGDQAMLGQCVDQQGQQRLTTDQRLDGRLEPGDGGPRRSRARHGASHGLDRRDELIALAVDGADDRLSAAVVVDRPAYGFDARGERRLADEPVTPDLVEQLLLAHDRAPTFDQVGQHVEGPGLELDLVTVAAQHDPGQIQLAVGEAQDHVALVPDPTRLARPSQAGPL